MSHAQFNASQRLMNLVFTSIDYGIEIVRKKDSHLTPALWSEAAGKITNQHIVAANPVIGVEKAREFVKNLTQETEVYVILYEGYVTLDATKYDAIMAEAGERGQETALVFAQRYQPKKFLKSFIIIGNVGFFGPAQNLFNYLGQKPP